MHLKLRIVVAAFCLMITSCGSANSVLVADAGDDSEATASVAEDSAPVETAALSADPEYYPFLDYFELDDRPRHGAALGQARFVLAPDDGEIAPSGSSEFPVFSFVISGWNGSDEPVATTISYSNFSVQNDELHYPQCGGVYAEFKRHSEHSYSVVRNRLPEVEDTQLAWAGDGCDEYLPIERAEIFDGTVETSFGDELIVVTSGDGRAWNFKQVPYALPIWD